MKILSENSHYDKYDKKNPRFLRMSEYQVAYDCDNHIIKSVKVHTQHNYGGGYYGILQIQKVGLDAGLESLLLLDGHPFNHAEQSVEGTMLSGDEKSLLSCSTKYTESLLEKFGKEFKIIFEENKKLNESLTTHFTALIPYLK